ncbi:MAG: hypothetical protein DRR04_05300 [Gammaproteobacteria bacterium]|nr:MAG: hypothetical protein DRQ97_06770 [Gammaproteobacteria bacterium]RLA60544.1 MAG: hypothetical protein DRR04_05300 [Gammaproteobacteria bacterium]
MKIKLEIKTPPGQARKAENQLRLFILGKLKQQPDTYISPNDNSFYWNAEVTVKQYFRIQRNAHLFQQLAGGTLDAINKKSWIKKMANITGSTVKGARALIDDTTITIIKQATANEIVEAKTTMWERIKKTFHKGKN